MDDIVRFLEAEWEKPDGFFGKAREGIFDQPQGEVVLLRIDRLNFEGVSSIDKRLVSLLWYIPIFLNWQVPRMTAKGTDVAEFKRYSDRMLAVLERVLGYP